MTTANINTKTMISVKLDKSLKKAAQETAEEIGISLGTLINVFLKKFVRDKEVTLSASYRPTQYLKDVIAEADKEFAAGNCEVAHSVDELMKQLRSR